MAATTVDRWGRVSSTVARSTGLTGSDSRTPRPTFPQAGKDVEGLDNSGVDQFFPRPPAEDSHDHPHAFVDRLASQVIGDQGLADRLEGPHPKIGDFGIAVEGDEGADGDHDIWITPPLTFAIVPAGEFEVVGDQFADRQPRLGLSIGGGATGGEPLGQETIVFAVAGLGAVRAEVMAASVQFDEGLAGGFVLAVGGCGLSRKTRHVSMSPSLTFRGYIPANAFGKRLTVDRRQVRKPLVF